MLAMVVMDVLLSAWFDFVWTEPLPGERDTNTGVINSVTVSFPASNSVCLVSGWKNAIALDFEGHVFAWGEGLAGQLGHGFKNN